MLKAEALILTGNLEWILREDPKLLGELKKLQERLIKGFDFEIAVSYGRLQYAVENSDIDISEQLKELYTFLFEMDIEDSLSKLTLKDLDLSVRTHNFCARAGFKTVKDIVEVADLKSIFGTNHQKCYGELVKKLKEIGIDLL